MAYIEKCFEVVGIKASGKLWSTNFKLAILQPLRQIILPLTFTSHTDLITATENTAPTHLIHFCDPYFDQAEARDWTERRPHTTLHQYWPRESILGRTQASWLGGHGHSLQP